MFPELLRIPLPSFLHGLLGPGIPIFGYGLMMVLTFLSIVYLSKFLARRSDIDPEIFVNVTFMALFFGVLGSRLSHIVENWSEYADPRFPWWQNLLHMADLREGGLTYYGGFLLATVAIIAYGLYKRAPIRLGMDIVAICLMVGLGIGRIGCFLNGCCYGAECSVPWAVQFPYGSPAYVDQVRSGALEQPDLLTIPDSQGRPRALDRFELRQHPELAPIAAEYRARPVHPAQLYSSVTALLLAGLLFAYFTFPHAPGRVFALMLMLEGMTRFLLELLRAEPRWHDTALSIAQVTSLFLVPAGMVMWLICGWLVRRPGWGEVRWDKYPQPTPPATRRRAAQAS